MKRKQMSAAEAAWRKHRGDERWERRVEYLLEFFSQPSALLPRPSASSLSATRPKGGAT